jgi:GABA(A) receptor-associated protein
MSLYKQRVPLGQRVIEASKIKQKFPGRIPVIVEKAERSNSSIPDIDKSKFLVPSDLSFGQFIYVIRKRMMLAPDKAIFLFVNNVLVASSELMGSVYNRYCDADGFLYVIYNGESTFGGNRWGNKEEMKYRS